jgi:4-aminobutyrate aminotransferase
LLVADEIQSGFGRTGKWFAIEHSDVVPDIMIMAKGMASGMPLSGIGASRQLMEKWTPGSHGGTYGGNIVASAAAVATIQVMKEENLIDHSAAMGQILMTGLRRLQEEHPEIGEVRGLGLMVASEFSTPAGQPWSERAQAVAQACHQQGLMLLTCGADGNIIRWIPPLVVNQEQLQEALSIFDQALNETK